MSAVPSLVNKGAPPLDHNSASVNIPLSKIIRSETNREAEVDEAFVESIRQNGVLQPIIVRKIIASDEDVQLTVLPKFKAGDEIYKLVAGERRFIGARRANHVSIPSIIRELTDTQAVEIQVEENEQRENLSPLDRCMAYCRLRDQYMKDHAGDKSYSATRCIEDVAKNRKVESRTVHQVIALSKLEKFLQDALRQGEMEASHGYEIARLEPEQQIEVLKWLRKETAHSQGDVPSVRRLKREITQMQTIWDAKKRQAALPLDGGSEKAQTSAVAKKPLENFNDYSKRIMQTPDPVNKAIAEYKPPSEAQIKKQEAAVAKEIADNIKAQRTARHQQLVDKKYAGLFFIGLAKKVQINSRFLSTVIQQFLFEVWDAGDVPFEEFCQTVLGWPAPALEAYEFHEVKKYCKKHTRKFTPNVFAALYMSMHMRPAEMERLGKYFGVDPKKLRAKATAAVKEEERLAKLPKVPSTLREKQLHYAVEGNGKGWKNLRKGGASNIEIRVILGEKWGLGGGHSSKHLGCFEYKGGVSPYIIFKDNKDDVLNGSALIQEVRDLLKIPEKGVDA